MSHFTVVEIEAAEASCLSTPRPGSRIPSMRALRHRRLATGMATAVSASEASVLGARPRRDRPSYRTRAHVWDPRARPHPPGGPRAEGRSQRLAAGRGEGRSRRVPVDSGAGARDECDTLGPPIQRLRADLAPWDLEDHDGVCDLLCEARPSGSAQPRCAPAPAGGAVRGGTCYSPVSGPRTSPERGDRAIDAQRARLL